MSMSATYSPEDNKLRLYSSTRLEKELYERVRKAGFIWAPKQDLFVAPAWSPSREDLLIELCGEVGDEDTSLVDRAEVRAERFSDYSENRTEDAERARAAVHRIADNIPLGQPILVGHHSERHARKDAEKIENGMRKAVKMWETAQYWKSRAAGAIRHAKYKELPAVRARRIKGIEADKRKEERDREKAVKCLKFWNGDMDGHPKGGGPTIKIPVTYSSAVWFAGNYDSIYMCFPLDKYPREAHIHQYEGSQSLYDALGGSKGQDHAFLTVEQAKELAIGIHTRFVARCDRWIAHYNNRLEYERAMLAASGGTATDKVAPEIGGACRSWCSPRGGYSLIQKVNKVSVTLLDNWGNGGQDFKRTIPFTDLHHVMSKAQVDELREAGRLIAETPRGFILADPPGPAEPPKPPAPEPTPKAEAFEAMKDSLRAGVQVVSAPQLFPTPASLAARMAILADIQPDHRVLEPSAGTGNLVNEIVTYTNNVTALEINHSLASALINRWPSHDVRVRCADFLECNGDLTPDQGKFDRIVMNPPFENGSDIKHIQHALKFLKPGGKLVAICANGSRQNEKLEPLADTWEELPEDTFKEQGTGVRTVLLTINAPRELQTPTQGGLF